MGNKSKVKKPHEVQSVIKEYLEQKTSVKELADDTCFVLSFKHLDQTQGSSFYDWQNAGILAHAIETIGSYCSRPLIEQFSDKFTVYGSFPSKSNFKHPSFVPPDAKWARIHINGLHVVAGHIFKNTFYVVFLDHNHTFYLIEK